MQRLGTGLTGQVFFSLLQERERESIEEEEQKFSPQIDSVTRSEQPRSQCRI